MPPAQPHPVSWMNCAAERCRVPPSCSGLHDGRRERLRPARSAIDLLDPRPALPARDLRAETEQLVTVREHHCAVDRRQAGDRRCRTERVLVATSSASRLRPRVRRTAARRHTGPAARPIRATVGSRRDHQQRSAAAVRAHRQPPVAPSRSPTGSTMPASRTRAATSAAAGSRARRRALVHHLDLIAFEHRNVDELARSPSPL